MGSLTVDRVLAEIVAPRQVLGTVLNVVIDGSGIPVVQI